jgi:hypothetical protein
MVIVASPAAIGIILPGSRQGELPCHLSRAAQAMPASAARSLPPASWARVVHVTELQAATTPPDTCG